MEVVAEEEKKPNGDSAGRSSGSGKKKKRNSKTNSAEEQSLITISHLPASDVAVEMSSLAPPSRSSPRPPPQPPPVPHSDDGTHTPPSSALLSLKTLMLDPSAESEFEGRTEMLDYEATDDLHTMSAPPLSKWDERAHTLLTSTLRIVIAVVVGVSIGGMGYCISYLVRRLLQTNLSHTAVAVHVRPAHHRFRLHTGLLSRSQLRRLSHRHVRLMAREGQRVWAS